MGNQGGLLGGGVISAAAPVTEVAGQAKIERHLMTADITGSET